MKKYEMIRKIFDKVLANGETYSHADAISSDCTRDGFINRVYVKKLIIGKEITPNIKVDSIAITCAKEDFSDAVDADVRVEFNTDSPFRTILWANELSDKVLEYIVDTIN